MTAFSLFVGSVYFAGGSLLLHMLLHVICWAFSPAKVMRMFDV